MITIFKNSREVKVAHYISVEKAIDRIRDGKSKDSVEEIRKHHKNGDDKRKSVAKRSLPSIIFSGECRNPIGDNQSLRNDKSLTIHSGFVVLDFDHVDPIEIKSILSKDPYIYSAWISPSGDGIKALVKVPSIIKDHEDHYLALIEKYPELDTTSKSLSRLCFESYDPDIYVNEDSKVWTNKFVKPKPISNNVKMNTFNISNDDSSWCENNIINTLRKNNGSDKHEWLIKASVLAGGFVSAGRIGEGNAEDILKAEISSMDITSERDAFKTIKDGLRMGKEKPLYKTFETQNHRLPQKEQLVPPSDINVDDFIYPKERINSDTEDYLTGKMETGRPIGIKSLDAHFVFKKNEFYLMTGKKGTGKTVINQALQLMGSIAQDLIWVCAFQENSPWSLKIGYMNYLLGERGQDVLAHSPERYNEVSDWVDDHIIFIKVVSIKEALDVTKKIIKNGVNVYAVLLDPINSFSSGFANTGNAYSEGQVNSIEILRFSLDYCSVFVNQHPIMSAQRDVKDVNSFSGEGGWLLNKASYTYSINRESGTNSNYLSVDTVRNRLTGGKHTDIEIPIEIVWDPIKIGVKYKGEPTISSTDNSIQLLLLKYNTFKTQNNGPKITDKQMELNPNNDFENDIPEILPF
jgi:hypothetical protein|tara:strand:+ start:888 stop:2789 length:1902 start_codon:yes stop_codon:yes gene_type:complete